LNDKNHILTEFLSFNINEKNKKFGLKFLSDWFETKVVGSKLNFKQKFIMKTTKILLGILAGVAGGAILGILFAPEKGSRTRRNISNKGSDYADDVKNSFEDLIDSMTKKYKDFMNETERVMYKQKAKYEGSEKGLEEKTS
jgi:gas vesicle protein